MAVIDIRPSVDGHFYFNGSYTVPVEGDQTFILIPVEGFGLMKFNSPGISSSLITKVELNMYISIPYYWKSCQIRISPYTFWTNYTEIDSGTPSIFPYGSRTVKSSFYEPAPVFSFQFPNSGSPRYITHDITDFYKTMISLNKNTMLLHTTTNNNGTASFSSNETSNYPYLRITYNNTPGIPSSISVPTDLKGGESFTVSYGTGSNATSYYLERSINGGSFTQVQSGSSRTYNDTTKGSWNTVAYRVRSYNTDGYSGYRTSPTRTVTHNTAPTTPSSITVPELRSGKSATISWGASTDVDGDIVTYHVERVVNNSGQYVVVSEGGTATSFTDTILSTWNTVQYIVYPHDGTVYGSPVISSPTTVKHFPEFKIRINSALKTSDGGWVRIDGVLREIESITIKINGALEEV